MNKDQYTSKYVGNVDKRRTNAYRKRGNKVNENQKVENKYNNLKAIKNKTTNDITGYIINNNVHAIKNSSDRSKRNTKESWEKPKGQPVI